MQAEIGWCNITDKRLSTLHWKSVYSQRFANNTFFPQYMVKLGHPSKPLCSYTILQSDLNDDYFVILVTIISSCSNVLKMLETSFPPKPRSNKNEKNRVKERCHSNAPATVSTVTVSTTASPSQCHTMPSQSIRFCSTWVHHTTDSSRRWIERD